MVTNPDHTPAPPTIQELRQQVAAYGHPDLKKAVWQIFNTFIPYVAMWATLGYLIHHRYPLVTVVVPLFLASLLLVRIFILFHDCTHSSFFASERANTILGYVAGIITLTPFDYWRYNHDEHHRTYADLDHRGVGDIWTLTVDEYRAASKWKRLTYRVARNPVVFLTMGPGFIFLVTQRLLQDWQGKDERRSVIVTNLILVIILWVASLTIGLRTFLLVQLPITMLAGVMGIWLFYVQHQFEGVYWSRHSEWDPVKAALRGSSYYKLPGVLRWFTANIGLHPLHHVMPGIPNYHLQKCYDATPALQGVPPLTITRSLKSLRSNLWDEKRQMLVSFRSLTRSGV